MKIWLALILAPGITLVVQSVLYAMVTPACSSQVRLPLHLVAALSLAVVVALAVAAFRDSALHHGEPASPDSDEAGRLVPRRFLATMAAGVAGIAALVIAAMWFALGVLSPCTP